MHARDAPLLFAVCLDVHVPHLIGAVQIVLSCRGGASILHEANPSRTETAARGRRGLVGLPEEGAWVGAGRVQEPTESFAKRGKAPFALS